MSLQFMQLFVALTVSFVLTSFLPLGGKRWRTVACGFLHNSYWVLHLQCLAVWRGPRQEKHNPLDMQRSCLSLSDFSRKSASSEAVNLPIIVFVFVLYFTVF